MEEPYRKGESDSILTPSLARVAVRWQAKRGAEEDSLMYRIIKMRHGRRGHFSSNGR